MTDINIGLEGVVVGSTAISKVEGEEGRLTYRGQDIAELVKRPFLQVAWLLLFGEFPAVRSEQQLAHFLLAHRDLNNAEREMLAAIPEATHPMLVLQALVPVLNLEQRADLDIPHGGDDALHGLIIAARLPSLVAAWHNRQTGRDWPVRSSSIEPHRAFLKAFHGREPDNNTVAALDAAQILQLEHSYNAGTFAGRVTLSTRAPIQSSIATSIGTLFGELHGGADQAALEFAAAVGSPGAAAERVSELLQGGGRVMGMGHREYSTVDPRATLLKPLARSLCETRPESARLLATLEAIEAACIEQLEKPGKKIRANVEFYKGAVFHALGIPSHFFTAMFASARVYGYIAHALEFRPESRLIRPRALYRGGHRGDRAA
jgi:citrate synthase